MAGLNPPPLLSPANTGRDSGGVTVVHGEIARPPIDPEVAPRHIHLCVGPHLDPMNAQDLVLSVHEPNVLVCPRLSLPDANWISDYFIQRNRISYQTQI